MQIWATVGFVYETVAYWQEAFRNPMLHPARENYVRVGQTRCYMEVFSGMLRCSIIGAVFSMAEDKSSETTFP